MIWNALLAAQAKDNDEKVYCREKGSKYGVLEAIEVIVASLSSSTKIGFDAYFEDGGVCEFKWLADLRFRWRMHNAIGAVGKDDRLSTRRVLELILRGVYIGKPLPLKGVAVKFAKLEELSGRVATERQQERETLIRDIERYISIMPDKFRPFVMLHLEETLGRETVIDPTLSEKPKAITCYDRLKEKCRVLIPPCCRSATINKTDNSEIVALPRVDVQRGRVVSAALLQQSGQKTKRPMCVWLLARARHELRMMGTMELNGQPRESVIEALRYFAKDEGISDTLTNAMIKSLLLYEAQVWSLKLGPLRQFIKDAHNQTRGVVTSPDDSASGALAQSGFLRIPALLETYGVSMNTHYGERHTTPQERINTAQARYLEKLVEDAVADEIQSSDIEKNLLKKFYGILKGPIHQADASVFPLWLYTTASALEMPKPFEPWSPVAAVNTPKDESLSNIGTHEEIKQLQNYLRRKERSASSKLTKMTELSMMEHDDIVRKRAAVKLPLTGELFPYFLYRVTPKLAARTSSSNVIYPHVGPHRASVPSIIP